MTKRDYGIAERAPRRCLRGFALALVLALGVPAIGTAQATGDCTVERHGPAAYARVKQRMQEKFPNVEQFSFDSYDKISKSVESDCVLRLRGGFSFKKQRNNVRRVYDVQLTPKSGAPQGMKIVKMKISKP